MWQHIDFPMNDKEKQALAELLINLQGELSQRKLAQKMGVTPYALNSWIHKAAVPSMDNLQRIAQYMGISWNQLMNLITINENKRKLPDNAVGCYELISHLSKNEKLKLAKLIINECI